MDESADLTVELPVMSEEHPQDLGQGEDELPVGQPKHEPLVHVLGEQQRAFLRTMSDIALPRVCRSPARRKLEKLRSQPRTDPDNDCSPEVSPSACPAEVRPVSADSAQ